MDGWLDESKRKWDGKKRKKKKERVKRVYKSSIWRYKGELWCWWRSWPRPWLTVSIHHHQLHHREIDFRGEGVERKRENVKGLLYCHGQGTITRRRSTSDSWTRIRRLSCWMRLGCKQSWLRFSSHQAQFSGLSLKMMNSYWYMITSLEYQPILEKP